MIPRSGIGAATATWATVLILAAGAAAGQQRFAQLARPDLTPQQRRDVAQAQTMTSSGTSGPHNVLLRSPVLEARLLPLEAYLRNGTSVPRRLNEFTILIQARTWRSQVEWASHYPLALEAGLSDRSPPTCGQVGGQRACWPTKLRSTALVHGLVG